MAGEIEVNVNQNNNQVNLTQNTTNVVEVKSLGPKGDKGDKGDASIVTGSLFLTGSINLSGSINLISGSLNVEGITYPTTDGENGDIIYTNGNGVLTFDKTKMYAQVKNISGVTLQKGTPVHVTSSVGNLDEVIAASASNPSTMPATFVLAQDLSNNQEGLGILSGFINGVDTSQFNEGDVVYVAANGGYTNQKPSGSNLIQNLGIVTKVAVNGSGFIYGSGRSNDTPNLLQSHIFFGSSSNQQYQTHLSSAIDLTTLNNITASGNISSSGTVRGLSGSLLDLTVYDGISDVFEIPIFKASRDGITSSVDVRINGDLSRVTQIGNDIPVADIFTARMFTDFTFVDNQLLLNSIAVTGSSTLDIVPHSSVPSMSINITGSLNVTGSTVDFRNVDITTLNNITASGDISSSGTVIGVTGSFSHLIGNSPITVNSPTTFTQAITGSIFSGSFVGDGSGITGIVASATPGGSNTNVQFNDSGTTSGSSDFTFDKSSGHVTAVAFSGSFSGSFVGDGSGLTGISSGGGQEPYIGNTLITTLDLSGQSSVNNVDVNSYNGFAVGVPFIFQEDVNLHRFIVVQNNATSVGTAAKFGIFKYTGNSGAFTTPYVFTKEYQHTTDINAGITGTQSFTLTTPYTFTAGDVYMCIIVHDTPALVSGSPDKPAYTGRRTLGQSNIIGINPANLSQYGRVLQTNSNATISGGNIASTINFDVIGQGNFAATPLIYLDIENA